MRRLRQITLLPAALLCALLAPAAAHADAAPDPSGFHLQSTQLSVNEDAGQAVITIERSDASEDAQIRYVTLGWGTPCGSTMCTAVNATDFTSVKGMLDFPVGVASESFTVPIVDHGVSSVPKTIQVSLFGPSPIGMASPSTAVLTILNNDLTPPTNSQNPLDLSAAPTNGNPLSGANFFVDPQSAAAQAAQQYPAIETIAREPGAERLGSFSYGSNGVPNIQTAVSAYLSRAQVEQPGTVPMMSTYQLVNGHCGHWADPPSTVAAYHNFINGFAAGIGSYRAVLFLEMDSIITMPCLSKHGQAVREAELRYAITTLSADCPHLVIYLDSGAADALPASLAAKFLRASGVAKIQGFFLNSTHYDWTSNEIRYGEQISRLTGGKHFVVNTGENGRGPLRPRDIVHQGMEVLCNPPGRGLGPLPTTSTGYHNVDAFAWMSRPGESGGACRPGAPHTAVYWPAYALMLVRNADFAVR
jgi:endoglucanase